MTQPPPPPDDDPPGHPPGGYPPGGYPPGGGFPPGPGVPPRGYPTSDDKTWALVAHFGGAAGAIIAGVFGWVAPLIALLARGPQSPTVRAHAVAALNFQVLWSIISLIAVVLASCLFWLIFPLLFYLVPFVPIIIGIVAGVRANDGDLYRYPMTVDWIK
jgi:uncharacterized protein